MAKRPWQVMPFKVTLLEIEPPILHQFSLRARGRKGGRPAITEETRVMAQALLADKGLTVR